jgi:hypothetical protein
MEISKRQTGFLYIISAYVQFIPVYAFYCREQNFFTGLLLLISALLVFVLSAWGLIILFANAKK